jgi:hypothetical protein
MLLKLIEKVPLNDNILFMIGDGPLSHAAGKRKYRERIEALMEIDERIARAWRLNVTDGACEDD